TCLERRKRLGVVTTHELQFSANEVKHLSLRRVKLRSQRTGSQLQPLARLLPLPLPHPHDTDNVIGGHDERLFAPAVTSHELDSPLSDLNGYPMGALHESR